MILLGDGPVGMGGFGDKALDFDKADLEGPW